MNFLFYMFEYVYKFIYNINFLYRNTEKIGKI